MIVKVEDSHFVQECVCGCKNRHLYSNLKIRGKFITLPMCSGCGKSIEVLLLNDKTDTHGLMVAQVFAKVATQG